MTDTMTPTEVKSTIKKEVETKIKKEVMYGRNNKISKLTSNKKISKSMLQSL